MAVVYVLWHVHTVNDRDNEKLVGVYRSEKDAKAAIERLKNKPGFKVLSLVILMWAVCAGFLGFWAVRSVASFL